MVKPRVLLSPPFFASLSCSSSSPPNERHWITLSLSIHPPLSALPTSDSLCSRKSRFRELNGFNRSPIQRQAGSASEERERETTGGRFNSRRTKASKRTGTL